MTLTLQFMSNVNNSFETLGEAWLFGLHQVMEHAGEYKTVRWLRGTFLWTRGVLRYYYHNTNRHRMRQNWI